jgi:putative transposase
VQRLLREMGLVAVGPKPRLSQPHLEHRIYPYLLRNLAVERVNQVWGTDITSIRLVEGWVYLVAIMDWFSRYVVAWKVSITLEVDFCLAALDMALQVATPEIFNSDQGVQFTSVAFTERLRQANVRISMDGRGRVFDNIFNERLWRSVKYEEVYLHEYETVKMATERLGAYFDLYNHRRLHSALGYIPPAEVYFKGSKQGGEHNAP